MAESFAVSWEQYPERWNAYIAVSQVDRLVWEALMVLLRRLRTRKPGSLVIPVEHEAVWCDALSRLNGWGLDVATGVRVEPRPRGRDARKLVMRNCAIVCAVNGIHDLGELPYASECAVERRVFLVGANPTQQLSLSAGSGRGGSWR